LIEALAAAAQRCTALHSAAALSWCSLRS